MKKMKEYQLEAEIEKVLEHTEMNKQKIENTNTRSQENFN
jgi:hypothetical protein